MDTCNKSHTPMFKIRYRPAKGSSYEPEWLVCENCHEKKYFGTEDDIVHIEKII